METSRTLNSLRNIAYGVVNIVVSIIFPFIVRTIFIKALGEEYLGLNGLYSSVLQVLSLADIGFASAIVASMYKPIADGDTGKVSALLNLYRKIYRIIGSIILVCGLVLTPFIDKLISGEPPADVNIYLLWLLYLMNTAVSYLFFADKVSLISAQQRNDITDKIGIICRTAISILQIAIVSKFKSLYLYVLLNAINVVVHNACCAYVCNRMYPQYTCSGELDSETKRDITKNIGALALQKIGGTISSSMDSIVISAFLGLTIVAIYGNYYYIISAIALFVNLIYGSTTASIGNSIAIETIEKNYQDFRSVFFLGNWVIGWCCVCFMCLFQDFMTVWMGENLLLGIPVVFALVARFYFEQIRRTVQTYKDACGMWWADKWKPLVGGAVNFVLKYFLAQNYGVAGIAISTIISYAFVEHPWEVHVLFKNYFHRSEREYYFEMLVGIVTMGAAGLCTYALCEKLPVNGIPAVCVKLIVCAVMPNLIFIALNFWNADFISSKRTIQKIFDILLRKKKA